jgi:hypothetical protein
VRLVLLSSVAAVSIGAATLAGGASGGDGARPGSVARLPVAKQITYFDERRENVDAPDIAEVVVSNGSAVWQFGGRPLARPTRVVTFRIRVPNRRSLTKDMRVALWIDVDASTRTGLGGSVPLVGADYLLNWDLKLRPEASLLSCRASSCTTARARVRASYANGASFSVLASDLGGTGRFRFVVLASSGIVYRPDGTLDLTNAAADTAPATGSWAYALPTRPRRLLVERFETAPKTPRPGGDLSVHLRARRDDTGALVRSGRVDCTATAGGQALRARLERFVGAEARCVLAIPQGTSGKVASGFMEVRSLGTRVRGRFTAEIG